MPMNAQQISQWCQGSCVSEHNATTFTGICHDSRQVQPSDLFVCLAGEHHRGEEFLAQAVAKGAAGALVHAGTKHFDKNFPLIEVEDTREALKHIAQARREEFTGHCLAITGSVGKTTTKDFLVQILRHTGHKITQSRANQNNELGLCLTMACLEPDDEFLIVEMGARHSGDIRYLCQMAKPDYGLITAIAPSHLETFKNLATIVVSKAELYSSLTGENSCAIVNAQITALEQILPTIRTAKLAVFTTGSPEDFSSVDSARKQQSLSPAQWRVRLEQTSQPGQIVWWVGDRSYALSWPDHGEHNLSNLAGALTSALVLGLTPEDILTACAELSLPPHRNTQIPLDDNNLVIDDTYNAQPESVVAGVRQAQAQRSQLWVVLAELSELGSDQEDLLIRLGQKLAGMEIAKLICVGAQGEIISAGYGSEIISFSDAAQALAWLTEQSPKDTCIYFKGSRAAQLDRLVQHYIQHHDH